jgi:hypothetical protein
MKRVLFSVWVLLALGPGALAAEAEKPLTIDVWPGKAPGEKGEVGPEKVQESKPAKNR